MMHRLKSLPVLLRTVAYLRPSQIRYQVQRRIFRPRFVSAPAPGQRPRPGSMVDFLPKASTMLGPNRFRFLCKEGELLGAADWNGEQHSKLWLYNLHYFDELSAPSDAIRTLWRNALIGTWIAENPPVAGNGWEPYTVSLRLVNWIKWTWRGHPFDDVSRQSLFDQTLWLGQNLEYHILGNHLFANAKALLFASAFFVADVRLDELAAKAAGILEKQLDEQVLEDGGHFELSPMYHCIILEDVLDLLNLGRSFGLPKLATLLPKLEAKASAMLAWLRVVCHPDGEIPLLNDAAFGIASSPRELADYAERLGVRAAHVTALSRGGTTEVTCLQASGYVRTHSSHFDGILDVGRIGPDYLPGHAHADTLSFEMSVDGERFIVDSGTSTYESNATRRQERGTAAHNTVCVDEQDSSEVWAAFRVGRRARPLAFSLECETDGVTVRCAHDGYRSLPGKPVHERTWRFQDDQFTMLDRVGAGTATTLPATARFHFSPQVRLNKAAAAEGQLIGTCPRGGRFALQVRRGRLRIEEYLYSPRFGERESASCAAVDLDRGQSEVVVRYLDHEESVVVP